MNVIALTFLIVNALGVLVLPRRWAPISLLASCCYMTTAQVIHIGPVSLTVYRVVLAAGLLRVVLRREKLPGGANTIDKLMVAWAAWLMFASLFHEWVQGSGPVYTSGQVFNIISVYFLIRFWCRSLDDLTTMLRIAAWLLVPVALAMVAEHVVEKNAFAIFGGVPESVPIRDGRIRAQGPFQHPILAGIVGAVCVPLMLGIWRKYRSSSAVGLPASVTMILASTSSTPLMSLFLGVGATVMWRFRGWIRLVRWAVIGAYLFAEALMTRPAYFLMSKVDFTGSSTGWYRSKLIQSSIQHLSEWWAFGTDDTGSWMYPNIDAKHSDITNYYIFIGVVGGLLAMILLIAIMWRAFAWIGESLRDTSNLPDDERFMVWCLGAGLFAHAASSLSVVYFDQSVAFFWLNVGAISALYSLVRMNTKAKQASLVRRFGSHPVATQGSARSNTRQPFAGRRAHRLPPAEGMRSDPLVLEKTEGRTSN